MTSPLQTKILATLTCLLGLSQLVSSAPPAKNLDHVSRALEVSAAPPARTLDHVPSALKVSAAPPAGNLDRVSRAGETDAYRANLQMGLEVVDRMSAEARGMEASKDYFNAFYRYQDACDRVKKDSKEGAPAFVSVYSSLVEGMYRTGVKLAEQRITEGRYADAEETLNIILSGKYIVGNGRVPRDAVVLMARLETPGYFNKTITPKFRASIEDVKKWLMEANDFYNTGRFDMAFKRCEQVLGVDKYNIAARRMEEKINDARSRYAANAYNEARSRAIWKVDDAWGSPVRKFGTKQQGTVVQEGTDTAGTAKINAKLSRIIIPKLDFKEASIREAVKYLTEESQRLDVTEQDPSQKGVNIVLKLDGGMAIPAPGGAAGIAPPADAAGMAAAAIPGLEAPPAGAMGGGAMGVGGMGGGNPADTPITLSLQQVPLLAALKYVTQMANLKYKVETFAVSVVPMNVNTDTLVTKTYKVRPGFIGTKPIGGGGGALDAGPAADPTKGGTAIAGRLDAKEYLMASGVNFPPGGAANYQASTSQLMVRNTPENLELVDALVENSEGTAIPAQVEIEAKFVEITQNNLKELSFDTLLGRFNIGNDNLAGSGGTQGTSPQLNNADYPFVRPGVTPTAVGTYPVTAGNRSGGNALSSNAIDALLYGVQGNSAVAPGIFGLAGIFTDPEFQIVIRALNQKKGVDLLSSPRVTTKSGNKAQIEIIREFRYPTEFDPPQLGGQGGGGGAAAGGAAVVGVGGPQFSQPVTPTTPTAFETRNTGVTLEVEPVIGPDGYTIDLTLQPQVVEFEGFVNYGSPIQTTSVTALGISQTTILTPNVINQPIFSVRKVTTSVTVFDGATVVLGGLMREDVQKVEDKVPGLGDIPLVGRLFRSSIDQHLKRNLIIFISARLFSPTGDPVHPEDESEEMVEVISRPEVSAPELPLMPK